MKNKAAISFNLETILKLIVAVICLFLLLYLAFSLYTIFITPSKFLQAKGMLNKITSQIDGLEDKGTADYLIINPKDYQIIVNKKEICVCGFGSVSEDFSYCKKTGVCSPVKYDVEVIPESNQGTPKIVLTKLPLRIIMLREADKVKIMTEVRYLFKKNEECFITNTDSLIRQYIVETDQNKKREIKTNIKAELDKCLNNLDKEEIGITDSLGYDISISYEKKTIFHDYKVIRSASPRIILNLNLYPPDKNYEIIVIIYNFRYQVTSPLY